MSTTQTTPQDAETPSTEEDESLPVHESIDVIASETLYKNDDWWKAAVLTEGYNDEEVSVYLWTSTDDGWKRKQKYTAKSFGDWQDEKEVVSDLFKHNF